MANASTINKPRMNGASKINPNNKTPVQNAATLHILLVSLILIIENSLLQVNPWNSLANVKVANAIVLAVIGLTSNPK